MIANQLMLCFCNDWYCFKSTITISVTDEFISLSASIVYLAAGTALHNNGDGGGEDVSLNNSRVNGEHSLEEGERDDQDDKQSELELVFQKELLESLQSQLEDAEDRISEYQCMSRIIVYYCTSIYIFNAPVPICVHAIPHRIMFCSAELLISDYFRFCSFNLLAFIYSCPQRKTRFHCIFSQMSLYTVNVFVI